MDEKSIPSTSTPKRSNPQLTLSLPRPPASTPQPPAPPQPQSDVKQEPAPVSYASAFRVPAPQPQPPAAAIAPQPAGVALARSGGGSSSTPAAAPAAPVSRLGRPPFINENSIQRRLECVRAVESGQMSMADACTAYDISSRTFYRWLRSKPKLVAAAASTDPESQTAHHAHTLASMAGAEVISQLEPKSPAKRPRVESGTRIEVVRDSSRSTKPESAASSGTGAGAGSTSARAVVNWYPGARAEDIIASITRQLGLQSQRWYLTRTSTGTDEEEVIVSEGLPSGKYAVVTYED